jgi:hypothetical protein
MWIKTVSGRGMIIASKIEAIWIDGENRVIVKTDSGDEWVVGKYESEEKAKNFLLSLSKTIERYLGGGNE